MSTWGELILKYQKQKRIATLNVNDDLELFKNDTINRQLPIEGKLLALEELKKSGNAAPVDVKKMQWEIYWHPLDEWGNIIYNFITENGMANTVCTVQELLAGDDSTKEEFHGLDQGVFLKALKKLESKQKCEIMNFDDSLGVKFF